jgi:hypothetical protein
MVKKTTINLVEKKMITTRASRFDNFNILSICCEFSKGQSKFFF